MSNRFSSRACHTDQVREHLTLASLRGLRIVCFNELVQSIRTQMESLPPAHQDRWPLAQQLTQLELLLDQWLVRAGFVPEGEYAVSILIEEIPPCN